MSSTVDEMSVVMVNFGSHTLIDRNLGSVDLTGLGIRVVVVDNYSSPGERRAIRELTGRRGWDLVTLAENRGFAAAVNAGIEAGTQLGSRCFLLLNPDAAATPRVMSSLKAECLARPLALIAPRIETSDGNLYFGGAAVDVRSGRMVRLDPPTFPCDLTKIDGARPQRWPWLTGACVAIHRVTLDRVGPLDDSYFLYWEDVDYSRRVQMAGGALVFRPDLVVIHDEGGTQGGQKGRAKSNMYYYYNCRNRLYFGAKYLTRREVARWMLKSPAASWEILMRGGKRQLLHSPRPALAASAGTVVGLAKSSFMLIRGHSDEAFAMKTAAGMESA